MRLEQKVNVLFSVALVGIGVALTYHIFENAVHESINLIWYDWFNTNSRRVLVVPLAIVISLIFFGIQHYLDRLSENQEEGGLGKMPIPSIQTFFKVLVIGYFSLLAGASLGPEAILVPASMILGSYIGSKLFANKQQIIKLLAAAGIMALFTAFFFSVVVGILSLALVIKQAKIKLNPMLLVVAVVASASSFFTLKALSGNSYFETPSYTWSLSIKTLLFSILLIIAGYVVVLGLHFCHGQFKKTLGRIKNADWWQHSLLASIGVALLYLLGGHLVEFTGNLSIVPMLNAAASLGLVGLLWILAIKIILISWSKASGYRGGMIFPTVFLAAVLVAIVQLQVKDFNLIYGLIAVLTGAFIANRKTRILV